jgi:hypothetical protein
VNHLFMSLSQSNPVLWPVAEVAIMLMSGGILYFFWEKILGKERMRH